MKIFKQYGILIILLSSFASLQAQGYWGRIEKQEPTLGIAQVYQKFNTTHFQLKLVKESQTVAGLRPSKNTNFDFTPSDRLEIRDKDGLYHLGDINLRIRETNAQWKSYSTASKRGKVTPIGTSKNTLAAADLANTLPRDIPVQIKRYYEMDGAHLGMRFEIKNKTSQPI